MPLLPPRVPGDAASSQCPFDRGEADETPVFRQPVMQDIRALIPFSSHLKDFGYDLPREFARMMVRAGGTSGNESPAAGRIKSDPAAYSTRLHPDVASNFTDTPTSVADESNSISAYPGKVRIGGVWHIHALYTWCCKGIEPLRGG